MAQFNSYDQSIDLSAIKDYCRKHGRVRQYAKDENFVQQGTRSRYLGVVESGYFNYIEFYNYERPHQSIGEVLPARSYGLIA